MKSGDVVMLKSGGCKMTVEHINEDDTANCVWHDNNGQNQRATYEISNLQIV